MKPGGQISVKVTMKSLNSITDMVSVNSIHSEVKSDMDVERLPSVKFETNALVLELTVAYNILRMIGQGTIGKRAPRQKRDVKRRRLRTVISDLIMMASHITIMPGSLLWA